MSEEKKKLGRAEKKYKINTDFDSAMGVIMSNKKIEKKDNKKNKLLRAKYGSKNTKIRIGEIEIPCFVLEDGSRVITGKGMQDAMGIPKETGGKGLTNLLSSKKLRGIVVKETGGKTGVFSPRDLLDSRIEFLPEGDAGRENLIRPYYGYRSDTLIDIAFVIMEAYYKGLLDDDDDDKRLLKQSYGETAAIIAKSFTKAMLIELIDIATGFREKRRDTIQQILDELIRKETALAWAKLFPDEFYDELFRLKKWVLLDPKWQRPGVLGHITNDIVYDRLSYGVLEELRRVNPITITGKRKYKHHQWLTVSNGQPKLQRHINSLVDIMKGYNTWSSFYKHIQRALPKKGEQLLLDIGVED